MSSCVRQGDCLEITGALPAGSVDLVYVDPPFCTQKNHALVTRDRSTTYQFNDQWHSRAEYVAFLRARLVQFKRVLRSSGSLFFHCDTSANHVIRSLLDEVFGEKMLRAEIIWHYRRWANSQRCPLPAHQTIYFYSKTDAYKYHQILEHYSPSTNVDQLLQRRQRDDHGKAVYARDNKGNVILDGFKRGVPIPDVWDIPFLNPKARERAGYPTQKPLFLLERIILLVTEPGDFVLDPFCGSGTTLVAAEALGRDSLGIDISAEAVELARRRLAGPVRTSSEVLRKGRVAYIQADEGALACLRGLPVVPVQRNLGIDAILPTAPGRQPVLIRVQRPGEPLSDAVTQLSRAGRSKQPATLILVATESQPVGGLFDLMPPGVLVVPSAAKAIRDALAATPQRRP